MEPCRYYLMNNADCAKSVYCPLYPISHGCAVPAPLKESLLLSLSFRGGAERSEAEGKKRIENNE